MKRQVELIFKLRANPNFACISSACQPSIRPGFARCTYTELQKFYMIKVMAVVLQKYYSKTIYSLRHSDSFYLSFTFLVLFIPAIVPCKKVASGLRSIRE